MLDIVLVRDNYRLDIANGRVPRCPLYSIASARVTVDEKGLPALPGVPLVVLLPSIVQLNIQILPESSLAPPVLSFLDGSVYLEVLHVNLGGWYEKRGTATGETKDERFLRL